MRTQQGFSIRARDTTVSFSQTIPIFNNLIKSRRWKVPKGTDWIESPLPAATFLPQFSQIELLPAVKSV